MRKFAVLIISNEISPFGSSNYEANIDTSNFGEYVDGVLKRALIPQELRVSINWGATRIEAEQKVKHLVNEWAEKNDVEVVYR